MFEELDRRDTPLGELSLRRRLEPTLQVDVYEVRLGEEYLMSSLFTVSEAELASLALAQLAKSVDHVDVLVGGLGLGYTARAALQDPRVRSLRVVEALAPVIEWHHSGLVPGAEELTGDARCELVHDDFFALLLGERPIAGGPDRYDAILVDIDHTPRHHLHPRHASFYTSDGLRQAASHLHADGVFALWSDGPPDESFLVLLRRVFPSAEARVVSFANFHTGRESSSTVYLGRPRRRSSGPRVGPSV